MSLEGGGAKAIGQEAEEFNSRAVGRRGKARGQEAVELKSRQRRDGRRWWTSGQVRLEGGGAKQGGRRQKS